MTKSAYVVPLLLALGACAANPTTSLDGFAAASANNSFETFDRSVDPPETLVLPVSHDRQTSGPSCGAHALASVINYWNGAGAVTGDAIFTQTPPAARDGYSLAELMTLARANGLTTSAVRLDDQAIIRELEAGRPVLIPVRVPSIFIQPWQLPGANVPVIGIPSAVVTSRVGRLAEWTGASMVNHYLVVVGYEEETFVVVEPVMGFRTLNADRLHRYREPFGNAAVVFSGPHPPRTGSANETPAPTG
jgi:hypothetical protein